MKRPKPDASTVIDYNGEGRWSRDEIITRYRRYATELSLALRDLTPLESFDERTGRRIYPVMHQVIEGIEAGDVACIRIGIEFIEEDVGFAFGRILKSNTARALRRATLTDDQKSRIRHRVFGMLRAGNTPREFREYAKLARRIGFDARELNDVPEVNAAATRYLNYFKGVVDGSLG